MRTRAALAAGILATATAYAQQVELSVAPTGALLRARLDWQAIPGQTYSVLTTPRLQGGAWSNTPPGPLTVSNVLGSFETASSNALRFFRIVKEDTDPPAVVELLPANGAIAVVSNAVVSLVLADETGIDTNSIRLSVAGWTNLTVAAGGVSYSSGTLTFSAPNALGEPGAVVTNALTVSDTLGHTLSNYTWSFQLARPTVATSAFLPLTAPPGGAGIRTLSDGTLLRRSVPGVRPLDGTDEYHIVAVTSNSVLFSYSGAPPAITNGLPLVSFDAAYPFYRAVTSNTLNETQQQITAWTIDLSLTNLVSDASLAATAFAAATTTTGQQASVAAALNLLHVEYGDDLSGQVLVESGGLKLHLPTANWSFVGDVDVAFDLDWGQLRSLDASAAGALTLNLSPEVIFYQAISGNGEAPLIQPITHVFGAMAGPVPVWVEVTMELNAGYEYSASVAGNARTTITAEKELTFHVHLRDNQWTHGVDNPPIVLEADPIAWQLEGTANAKVYVQPKLTVLVYSLAGLWADISPCAEFDGHYQANPLGYDLGLYFGLSSTLGVESRIWYPGWGDKPEWLLFDQKWPLWSTNYPNGGAPGFVAGFPNRTVQVGQSLTLSGHANGNPTPAYKWYFNGTQITGANGPEYAIAAAQAGHAGTYAVQAYNTVGSVQTSCYVTVCSGVGDHLIVDLSAGPSASNYPVSYMTGVPAGGWPDAYKTTKMVFRRIPAGTFMMGSPVGELGREYAWGDETQHQVTLTQPFYIGVFEVTQRQWERVMGTWPSWFNNASYRDSRPVEQVSYNMIRGSSAGAGWPANSNVDADSFMGRLRARTGRVFDLPTESQWEYAGRAGTTTALNSGKNLTDVTQCPNVSEVGRYWYNGGQGFTQTGNTSTGTAKAGAYLPNAWGLYDIHGNVYEWCLDWFPGYEGSFRVGRGGGWSYYANECRVAQRGCSDPGLAGGDCGFRAVLPPGQ